MTPNVLIDMDVHTLAEWPELEREAIAAWNTRPSSPTKAEPVAGEWVTVPATISEGDSISAVYLILEDFGCEDLSVAEAYAKIVETTARPLAAAPQAPDSAASDTGAGEVGQ